MNGPERMRIEELVLARLLVPSKKPPAPSVVAKAVAPIVGRHLGPPEWKELFEDIVNGLRKSSQVEPKAMLLTPSGEKRIIAALGIKHRSEAKDWAGLKRTHLAALALGFGRDERRGLFVKDGVRTALLRARLGLSRTTDATLARTVDQWIARKIGLRPRDKVTASVLKAYLLAQELGLASVPKLTQVVEIAIAYEARASSGKANEVMDAILASWVRPNAPTDHGLTAAEPTTSAGAPVELERLVQCALDAARRPDVRRFGNDKVFIGSVWEKLAADPIVGRLGLERFKEALVDAHRKNLLRLSRADLVSAMDPRDVSASETSYLNSTFHFIYLGGEAK